MHDDLADGRLADRQRTGLVEHDGVGLREKFEVEPPLHEDAHSRRARHRGNHDERRRESELGGRREDHERHDLSHVVCH